MMRTLDPSNGLTAGWEIAQRGPLWTLVVDIGGLEARGTTVERYPMHVVGAHGASRADTVARAAGEAVERFALMPREGRGPKSVTAAAVDLGADGLDFARSGLGDPDAVDLRTQWYQGKWLDSGDSVWVPAGLIDYPVVAPEFDPTPSGAAAGPSLEFAVRGALLEIIERDAVAVAWASGAGLRVVDLDAEIAEGDRGQDWRLLAKLRDQAYAEGMSPTLVRVPVLPGLHCFMAAVTDGRTYAAVGAKVHEDVGRALLIAFQEALQVRSALQDLRCHHGEISPPSVIRDDLDRARLWMTEPAIAELEARLSGLPQDTVGVRTTVRWSTDELVRAVVADGARPVVVDLTTRLPEVHQSMGWRAVKVVSPGYQQLRMDESHQFGWQHARITAAATGPVSYFPHPLI